MREIQGKNTIGSVMFIIEGNNIEAFLELCVNHDIPMWEIKMNETKNQCEAKIYLHHKKKVQLINESLNGQYKIIFLNERGCFSFIYHFIRKKHIFIATILSLLTLFFISNITWSVNIHGVSQDIETKIKHELKNHGIHVGSLSFKLQSLPLIQQTIVNDIPELLWVGIEKKGTSFFVEGVEKKIAQQEESTDPQHLVAKKNGIIEHMYVRQGVPEVSKYDYVKKGDLLVSGIINQNDDIIDEENEEDETEKQIELTRAIGDVYAQTWYEIDMSIPLESNYKTLTGENKQFYKLKLGNIRIPLFGFKKPKYGEIYEETNVNQLSFIKWELPIHLISVQAHELENHHVTRTENEAVQVGINQAKKTLQLQLGKDAKILSNYILHEDVDNGKVKLNLYISALENIALEQNINN